MRRVPRALARTPGGVGRLVLGPWPIYPSAMGLVAAYGLIISAGSRTQVGHRTIGSFVAAIWPQWLGVIVLCLIVYAVLRVLNAASARVRAVDRSRAAYCATMVVASALITLAVVTSTQITVDDALRRTLPPFGVRFAISLPIVALVLFIGNGVIAAVRARLARQEEQLAGRVDALRSERALLLAAEEQVREQASQTLHDDIQAALLRSIVRLEGIRDTLDDESRRLFDTSIAEIETVREERVRALGRALSPNIADIGVLQAIEELAALYEGVMQVSVDATDQMRERLVPVGGPRDADLALYRIVEQGLLNAIKHGRARAVRIDIAAAGEERIRMAMRDDGGSPAPDVRPGTGSATISAWIDAVGGEWSLSAHPDGGTLLVAVIDRPA